MSPDCAATAPEIDTKILGLNITEQCNLRCSYCYQVARRSPHAPPMTFACATRAIADHLSRRDKYRHVVIELIGGEVFLYFDLIRSIVEWTAANSERWAKSFYFFIDTNGTLLTPTIKTWLRQNRDFVRAGLSLDGTPQAHDLNRCGSYARIAPHLEFLATTWDRPIVKMTISPQTVPMIYDSVLHLVGLGFEVAANVPMEDVWGSPEAKARTVEEFRRQIEKLVKHFGSRPNLSLPNLINLPVPILISSERDRPWCGSGRNMVTVDANGDELPCNRYASMSFDQSLFHKPIQPDNSKCRNCMFRAACQTCEVLNWEVNGNPQSRTTFHCEFTKLQIWGTAQVLAMRFERGIDVYRALSPDERAACLPEAANVCRVLNAVEFVLNAFESCDQLSDVGCTPTDETAAVPIASRPAMQGLAAHGRRSVRI